MTWGEDNNEFWANNKKIKSTPYFFQVDTNIVFEPADDETDPATFIGLRVPTDDKAIVYKYDEESDFPDAVSGWAQAALLIVKDKKTKKVEKKKTVLEMDSDDDEECELSDN
jgi:hypothetical protein